MQWHDKLCKEKEEGIDEVIERRFVGTVAGLLLVQAGGGVSFYRLINGKGRAAIDSEAAEHRRVYEAAQEASRVESEVGFPHPSPSPSAECTVPSPSPHPHPHLTPTGKEAQGLIRFPQADEGSRQGCS